jgi:hypothetical protein
MKIFLREAKSKPLVSLLSEKLRECDKERLGGGGGGGRWHNVYTCK